jgi:alpha-L-fucosidase
MKRAKSISNSLIALLFLFLISANNSVEIQAQTVSNNNERRLVWWQDARFGMFIHWGVFAVPAGIWDGKPVHGRAGIPDYSEWLMYNAQISCTEYQKLTRQFTASKYNPADWVNLARTTGMKYIVITAKHHDGFAMFETKASPFNIVTATPYAKDPLKGLAEECRKQGIKLGFYYSQAQDWNNGGSVGLAGMGDNAPPTWDKSQTQDMESYINKIAIPQISELLTNYGSDIPAIIWWDTPRGMTKPLAAKINQVVHELKPDIIMNNRLGGGIAGDSKTPEQYIPAMGYPGENWETCMTTNNSWGYQSWDNQWKSSTTLLRSLSDIVSKGGNFLLNVGPDAEGLIPEPSVKILNEVGKWLQVNGECIYGTEASPFAYLSWGKATQKGNKLYLHVHKWPVSGKLKVPVSQNAERVYMLSNKKRSLSFSTKGNYTSIHLPAQCPDTTIAVVVMEMKGEIKSSISNPIPSIGKNATASSFESEKFKAANAVDLSSKTTWKAAKGVKQAWLTVDLEKPISIGHIALSEKVGHTEQNIRHFRLEYQSGEQWIQIAEGKKIGEVYQASFKPVVAQFFRLNILDSETEPEIKDMQLFFEE